MSQDLGADENFIMTCGSTESMIVSMMTLCNPGDRVVVFSPLYEKRRRGRRFQFQSRIPE